MTLLELADACERAKGADTVLDEKIAVAIGWQRPMLPGVCGPNYSGRNRYEWHDRSGQPMGFFPPTYTASLDAAMQIVPSDRRLALVQEPSGLWQCAMLTLGDDARDQCVVEHVENASLAICAAALRARHAMESE